MIQALIFDFDGTILETEQPDYIAWCETYQEHQCELPLTLWLSAVGGSAANFDPYAYLEQQVGRALDRPAVRAKLRARLHELVAQQEVRAGVLEAISAAKEMGLRVGIASSSSRDWVESHLARLNLRHHFEVICTREDVALVKPDPALYSLAVQRLGVQPAAAVAIEDSRNGLLAARAAGLKCVIVPNEMTKALDFPEADLLMHSLADRPLAAWLADLQTVRPVNS